MSIDAEALLAQVKVYIDTQTSPGTSANRVAKDFREIIERLRDEAAKSSDQPDNSIENRIAFSKEHAVSRQPVHRSELDPLILVCQEAIDAFERLKLGHLWGARQTNAISNLRQEMREHLKRQIMQKPSQPVDISKVIYKALNGHKMIHQKIRDTDMALPLVDYLTPEGWTTINGGMEENEAIAETIAEAIISYLKPEPSQPVDCREAFEKWCYAGDNDFLIGRYDRGDYIDWSTEEKWQGFQAGWNARATTRESGDVVSALKDLTEYVQEQAALHHLDWQVLADNQVLVNAVKALSKIEDGEAK